jgi:hypothetical protein
MINITNIIVMSIIFNSIKKIDFFILHYKLNNYIEQLH